jgi:glycosyltransferase involved in cell wall biosynthesis
VWIGGSSKKTLRNFNLKIRNLGLKNSVTYLGFRKDIQAILRCSDLLISPSLMENLSLAILEAMAAGLPVIATNCGGSCECVVDGQTGFIVPVNDSIKLSEKIIEISGDEKRRKMFGENGFTRFLNNFSANVCVGKFEKLYSEILNDREFKPISAKEKMLVDSFLQVYEIVSENHWKLLRKSK